MVGSSASSRCAAASSAVLVCSAAWASSATRSAYPASAGGRSVLLAGLGSQLSPVGAQRLQHEVQGPAIPAGSRRGQQRAVHQPQYRRPGVRSGHGLGAVQGERPGKHRHGTERPLLALIQQLVAPFHGGGQRLLPGRRQPVPAGQQREPVIETVQKLVRPSASTRAAASSMASGIPSSRVTSRAASGRGLAIQDEARIGPAGPVREQR